MITLLCKKTDISRYKQDKNSSHKGNIEKTFNERSAMVTTSLNNAAV